jgi:hypothetical protein
MSLNTNRNIQSQIQRRTGKIIHLML